MSLSVFGAEVNRFELLGHVPAVVPKLPALERLPATNELSLALGLPLRNRAELEELLHQLYDPASTNYHKFLNLKAFAERFGPTEDAYLAVRHFAESHGLTVIGTHPNRLVLDVRGPVARVEKAFEVSLHRYRHPSEARTFFAPDAEPSVPTNVPVVDLWGLTDFALPTPLTHQMETARISPLSYNGTGPSGSYEGRDFRNAYASGSALVGSGQVAAVAEFDGYFATDITNYEYRCGYTNVPLTNILLDSVSGTPGYSGVPNAVAEVSLDIELIIAMAPGLSRLAVYEGDNPFTVFSQIASDNTAKQISCSWSWGVGPTYEFLGMPGSTLDSLLGEMAAQGQSVFQASGDSDADTGTQSVNSSTGPLPVDSIYLTSVGGTSLTTSSSGTAWSSEKVWNWGGNEGSSGGISTNYTIPYWQTNVSMSANGGSTKYRNFPDVALTADAVEVVYSNGISAIFGGTSCAAPLWAGFTALVNQQAVGYGRTNVGFLNPALYAIAGSINYTNCFHDITNGNNIGTHTAGLFYAVTNYDLATGLGTPAGTNLINALAPPKVPYLAVPPFSQSVAYGATVTFGTIAEGSSPLSYQWLFNGTNLPATANVSGTTTNTLTLTVVTLASAGSYQLVVTNPYGAVTSSVAALTVTYPPSFTTEPTNQSVVAGGAVQFTATVAGGAPLAYQWQQNGTNLVAGINITGVATNALTLTEVTTNGAGNYTLIVTNVYGAATSSAALLTVWEPTSIAPGGVGPTIQCGSNVSFTVTANGTPPLLYQWSMDGSDISGATNASLALTNVHLPSHTVAVVVTNLYGSATSSVSLTVEDTLPPTITLNGINPYYLELGSSYVEPGATAYDLCAGTVAVAISGTVNTSAVSTNTVTYTANDGNGNANTATRTVIVRDTTPPTIVWSLTNSVLAANSNCEAIMPNVTGTNYLVATDASGLLTITQTPTNNATLPLGTNLVVITVADASGNKSYSTNNLTVEDQTPPVITILGANPFTSQLGAAFSDPGVTAVDTCSGIAWVQTNGTVNVNAVGTNLLTYFAVDGAGNTNSATRTVIVRDTMPPTILWSFTNLVLAANSNCEAVMPNLTGTNGILATDLSGVASVTQTPTNGAILPLGTNLVVFAVADPYGNTAYSTNQLVVQDETPPTITLLGANPFLVELGTVYTDPGATAVDTCSGVALLVTNGTVNANVVGTNLLTYVAVDGAGNTNSATRTVVVRDTTPPTILWSFNNLVLAANSNCEAIMPNVTGTNGIRAADLSGVASVTQMPTNGAVLLLGTNQLIFTVTDPYGNVADSTNQVVVEDQTPPVITVLGANPFTLQLGTTFTDPGVTAADTCSGIAWLQTNGTVNVNAVGTNLLTYVAVDGTGNTNRATRTVIVQDTLPPTILWSFTNLVLAANSNCEAIMPNVTGTNGILATDLVSVATIVQNPTNGAILPLGTNVVVITVTDLYGNVADSTNQVVVEDQTPPVITVLGANPFTLQLGTAFTDPGVTAADTCSGIAWLKTNGTVNVNAVGTNLLTYVAVDGAGNTNHATRTVIVRDTLPPTILWSFTNLVLAANSNCEAIMPNVTGTNGILATDLVAVATIVQNPTNGAILPLGTNVVVITVTDLYGNVADSTNQVVVEDQTPPVITVLGANPFTLQLGTAFTDPGVTAADTCSGIAWLKTNGTVNVNAVGTNLLTYVAVDGAGNTNHATRTVIVRDTLPPTILWSFTNLVLAANSNCEAIMPNVTGTNGILATDLVAVATIVQNPTNGAILPLGTNVVVITVTDPYGNVADSTNQVVVEDQTPPVITVLGANPVTLQLGTIFTDPGVTAADTCSGIALLQTNGTVNVNAVGTNLLTYVAVDGAGNTNRATRTVIVRDTLPPTILWSFTNLVLAANSNCEAVMPNVTGTNGILATDLVSVATIVQNPTNGAILPLGTNFVVITVTDLYGNVADSTNQVVVEDQTPPVVTVLGANPFTLQLGTTFTDPGVTAVDTCSGIALLQTNGTVNVNAVGTNLLTYVVVDGAGNTNRATRTVIVQDTMPPTILWSFTNLVLAANSNCEAVMPNVTGTNGILATDLVSVATIVQNPTNGTILPLGTNFVVITVTDLYGNVADSTNQVVVEDQTPPVITVLGSNPFILQLGTTFTDPGVTAADTCSGIASLQTNGTVNVNAVGTNLLTYLAVDGAGNTNRAARTVIVQDTLPPTILWSFTNLVLAANSNCEAVMPNVTGTNGIRATDLSGVALVTQVPTNGSILPLGTNIVILAVGDPYGNTAYSTNQMVVEDQTPPFIWAQPQGQTNVLGATANFSVVATACTPISYQWLFKGVALAVQTNASLVCSNLALGAAGSYAVALTSAGGSVTSSVAFLVVTSTPTVLSLMSSANPTGFKDSLTFIAGVTPVGATGSILFLTNGTVFDSEVLAGGTATSVGLALLPRGTNTVTALYPGDGTYLPATNSIAQVVTNHPPVVTPAYYIIPAGQTLTIPVTNLATHWSDVDDDPLTIAWISPSTNGVVVTNALPTIYYANTNYVNDLFVCAITDGWGGTNIQTIYITVLPQTNSTPRIAVAAARSSTVSLQLGGASGATYVLEYATNLVSGAWTPLATNVLNPTGAWQYTDTQVAGQPRRFFRLQLVTP